MSRIFARSVVADILARVFSALLFVLLAPFIFIFARRFPKGPTRPAPASAPQAARTDDRTSLKRRP